LLEFGRNNLKATLGITAVLHTWSQNLLDHYHLHCVVTGGGLSLDGQSWVSADPKSNNAPLNGVIYANGQFVAPGAKPFASYLNQVRVEMQPSERRF